MDGPFRTSEPEDLPVRLRQQLTDFDLRRGPGGPFAPHDDEWTTTQLLPTGFAARFKTRGGQRWPLPAYPLPDIAVRATIHSVSSAAAGIYLIVRRFEIGGTWCSYHVPFRPGVGTFRVEARVGNGTEAIVPWQRTDAFRPRMEPNTVELRVAGQHLVLLVNGQCVHVTRDRSFGRGCPAIELAPESSGDELVLESVQLFEVD